MTNEHERETGFQREVSMSRGAMTCRLLLFQC